jgi:hypothetical protein
MRPSTLLVPIVLVVAVGCGARHHHGPAPVRETVPVLVPPSVASLETFETAWQHTKSCLLHTDADLAALDPRDALPLANARGYLRGDEDDNHCPGLDALVAAAPAASSELVAAVGALPALWDASFYADDTGLHTMYESLEAFANGMRDVDDWRTAVRRAANLSAISFATTRIPLATIGPALHANDPSRMESGRLREHVVMFDDPAWTAVIDDDSHTLVVSDPPNVTVATRLHGDVIRRLGVGRDRAIAVGLRGGNTEIFVSHDAGATWSFALAPSRATVVYGDPRALDLRLISPPTWIHVGADGVVAAPVPVSGKSANVAWECATSDVIWLVNDTLAHWTDRSGAHGAIPYAGTGGFGCAGRALLAPGTDDLIRCVAGAPACTDANPGRGWSDLTSDGIVVASATGSVITLTRTGARPSVSHTRLAVGAELAGFAVWADVPTLIVRDEDGLHAATAAP